MLACSRETRGSRRDCDTTSQNTGPTRSAGRHGSPWRCRDGGLQAVEPATEGRNAAGPRRPPPQGVHDRRGDLAALLDPRRDVRGERGPGAGGVREAHRTEDDGEGAKGRQGQVPPMERGLRPIRPGGARRDVHDLLRGAGARSLEADAEDAEPDLPADDGAGDPQDGARGAGRVLRAPGRFRAPELLCSVPGDGLRFRVAPDGGGGNLLLLQALGKEQPARGGQHAGRASGRAGADGRHLRGAGRRDARRQPDLGVAQGAAVEVGEGAPVGPQLRAASQGPRGAEADAGFGAIRQGDAQAQAGRQRRLRAVRLAGRVRPAVRRGGQGWRRTPGRPGEDLPRQRTDGADPDGGGDGAGADGAG